MRSQRLQFTDGAFGAAAGVRRFDRPCRHPDCGTGRTRSVAARGTAWECVHRRAGDAGPRHRACGRRHLDRSRRRVDHGHQLELHPTVPDDMATFTNNGAPHLGHHLEHHLDQHHRVRRRGARLFVHRSERGDLHGQQTATVRRSCRTSASAVARRWRSGTEARSRSARWRVAAPLQLGTSDPNTTLIHRGKHQHHLLAASSVGRGLARARRAATLTLTGHRQHDRRRSRPL